MKINIAIAAVITYLINYMQGEWAVVGIAKCAVLAALFCCFTVFFYEIDKIKDRSNDD